MHHKLMIVDAQGSDPTVITGSLNWTAADNRNSENTVIVHDGATAQTLAAGFVALWAGVTAAPCASETVLSERLYLPVVQGGAAPTPVPTETPPPVTPATVRLARIVYNPDGDDVAGERVEVRNLGDGAADLTGWTLADAASYVYGFPAGFVLPAQGMVTVWVKAGTDTGTELYSGRGSAVWNNEGDTATVRDQVGNVVDACSYGGGGVEAGCE